MIGNIKYLIRCFRKFLTEDGSFASRAECMNRLSSLGYETIKEFQRMNNLKPNGRLTWLTRRTLFSYYCVPAARIK